MEGTLSKKENKRERGGGGGEAENKKTRLPLATRGEMQQSSTNGNTQRIFDQKNRLEGGETEEGTKNDLWDGARKVKAYAKTVDRPWGGPTRAKASCVERGEKKNRRG